MNRMKKEERIIEFVTNRGVEIKLLKKTEKYYILVSDSKKKVKNKKVFDSLDMDTSMQQFFKVCNFFTKELR